MSISRFKTILDKICVEPLGMRIGVENIFVSMMKEHISIIVGLSSFGVNVDTNYQILSYTFIMLFGCVEKNAMRPNLEAKLFELAVMKDRESCLDFVRIFILFVCIVFYFLKRCCTLRSSCSRMWMI